MEAAMAATAATTQAEDHEGNERAKQRWNAFRD
jgi:hypothetical protein